MNTYTLPGDPYLAPGVTWRDVERPVLPWHRCLECGRELTCGEQIAAYVDGHPWCNRCKWPELEHDDD